MLHRGERFRVALGNNCVALGKTVLQLDFLLAQFVQQLPVRVDQFLDGRLVVRKRGLRAERTLGVGEPLEQRVRGFVELLCVGESLLQTLALRLTQTPHTLPPARQVRQLHLQVRAVFVR